jgi:hypothetical protein
MALPGISNANEFYSAHYLESVLAGDIKKVRERWAEQAKAQLEADLAAGLSNATASTPEAQFKALRKPWQKLREAEIGITEEPAERLRLQRELFFQPLLEALGYPFAPHAEPVLIGGEAYQVPLLGEVSNAKGYLRTIWHPMPPAPSPSRCFKSAAVAPFLWAPPAWMRPWNACFRRCSYRLLDPRTRSFGPIGPWVPSGHGSPWPLGLA